MINTLMGGYGYPQVYRHQNVNRISAIVTKTLLPYPSQNPHKRLEYCKVASLQIFKKQVRIQTIKVMHDKVTALLEYLESLRTSDN